MKYYAGIGSRQTPPDVLEFMTGAARKLSKIGYRMRSGGASGADTAFEVGAEGEADIYLPWKGFNHRQHGIVCGEDPALLTLAAQYHPNWKACRPTERMLHTRNVAQVLGRVPGKARPSRFVVCWTEGGRGRGGTGQAIRIAKAFEITVYDLGNDEQRTDFMTRLSQC